MEIGLCVSMDELETIGEVVQVLGLWSEKSRVWVARFEVFMGNQDFIGPVYEEEFAKSTERVGEP